MAYITPRAVKRKGAREDLPTMTEMPIVLIPGLNCTAAVYSAQVPELWQFGPVTVAHHRHGRSMAGIAARILAAAPPRFALGGFSMGGYIALEIMRQAPERVLRLALIDTSARPDAPEQTERRRQLMDIARAGGFARIADLQFPNGVHPDNVGDEALRILHRDMALANGMAAYLDQQEAIISRPDSRPDLAAIACPTLIVWGDHDRIVPPSSAEEFGRLIPDSRVVVFEDTGHVPMIERPDRFNQLLVDFLEEEPGEEVDETSEAA